jgi:hypothetical protein
MLKLIFIFYLYISLNLKNKGQKQLNNGHTNVTTNNIFIYFIDILI